MSAVTTIVNFEEVACIKQTTIDVDVLAGHVQYLVYTAQLPYYTLDSVTVSVSLSSSLLGALSLTGFELDVSSDGASASQSWAHMAEHSLSFSPVLTSAINTFGAYVAPSATLTLTGVTSQGE